MKVNKALRQLIIITGCLLFFVGLGLAQDQQATEKFKEFNFWEGDWKVYKTGTDSIVGKSKIKAILKNMAIRENYKVHKGEYKGTSLNKYNQNKGKWEQFWVDNTGLTLHLEGGLQGNKMVMETAKGSGGSVIDKISWENKSDGTVRQIWTQSKDNKQTWKTLFDGTYVKEVKEPKEEKKKKDDKKKK